MRLSFFLLTASLLLSQDTPPSPQEIARQAVRNYQKDQLASLRYEYMQADETRNKGVLISHVVNLSGLPYERLVSRDGKPLPPKEDEREQRKFEKEKLLRQNELKGQRDIRIRKWKEQTRFLEEAPDAFEFKLLPNQSIDGRDTYVLECSPKAGFEPRQDRSKMFQKINAKAWVDVKDLRIVKLQADTSDQVAIGWGLARIAPGTHMEMEQMRLPDGNWVLKTLGIDGQATILMVDKRQLDETVTYSAYRADPNAKPLK